MVSFPCVSQPPPCMHLSSSIRATCPAHLILLGLITRKIFVEQYRSLSSSLRSFLHSPVTLSLYIFLSNLFSKTLSLRSSLNIRDQFSDPYKTAHKITILYTLIFKYLGSPLEDKTLRSYVVTLSCILISRHDHIFILAFTSSPVSLLETTQAPVFFFTVRTLPPNILTSLA